MWLLLSMLLAGDIQQFPGAKPVPHDKYIRVVSEADSPVERVYVKSRDGVYVAAALRKPKGPGPFPVLVHFHGAPGGRGMDQLVGWARGDHGSPVFERFLQEGYAIVIAEQGYHDFVMGPQGQNRSDLKGGEQLLDITLQALESSLRFVRQPAP